MKDKKNYYQKQKINIKIYLIMKIYQKKLKNYQINYCWKKGKYSIKIGMIMIN